MGLGEVDVGPGVVVEELFDVGFEDESFVSSEVVGEVSGDAFGGDSLVEFFGVAGCVGEEVAEGLEEEFVEAVHELRRNEGG